MRAEGAAENAVKIKLCGMMRREDIETVNELLPDYVGFVLTKGFRRSITSEQASSFREILNPAVTPVGVFVDEEPERIARLLERHVIDMAQLHGGEDEAYIRRLQEMTDRPVIKAFRVDGEEAVRTASRSSADLLLLDSGTGTGRVFDWTQAAKVGRAFFLAGGLNPDNVLEAVKRLRPFGVDVSSGIETEGRKDPGKMRRFVQAVRETE